MIGRANSSYFHEAKNSDAVEPLSAMGEKAMKLDRALPLML